MIRIFLYAVVAILIMSFFGISIQGVIESPSGQENIAYVWNLILSAFRFVMTLLAPALEWIIRLVS